MGIDIYLGGYDAFTKRTKRFRPAWDAAVVERNRMPKSERGSAEYERRQAAVLAASDAQYCGANGYLRSSYNNGGLFNVLDRIFGTDSAALLLPGNWDKRPGIAVKWDEFLAVVAQMKAAAKCLRHGVPLPVRFEELEASPHKSRQKGEKFGAMVGEMFTALATAGEFDSVEAGSDHQHGFYNDDDYGWYVREGLDELEAFGKLGRKLAAAGKPHHVYISY